MIVLLGYMGSGKSSVAEFLAKNKGFRHLDLDKYIEAKEDLSVSKIFDKKGEIYFRKIETKYLIELLHHNSIDVLSVGGGTPCYADNMKLINDFASHSYYLKIDLDVLTKRLFKIRSNRPLISHFEEENQLLDFVRKHLFEREFYYRQAKRVLNVSALSVAQIAETIIAEN